MIAFNECQRQSLETIFIMETSIMLSNVTFGYHLLFIGYPYQIFGYHYHILTRH